MDVENKFPFEIREVEPKLNAELKEFFSGQTSGFVQIGPHGYCLPAQYRDMASAYYNMPLRSSDVFVATFPRSGTTVTQALVWMVANNLDYEKEKTYLHERFPFLESSILIDPEMKEECGSKEGTLAPFDDALKQLNAIPSPRFIKTHLPMSLLPPSLLNTTKTVYVARDPRDVVVSFYHLSRLIRAIKYTGNFKQFWNYFRRDLISWAPYWQHLKEAWELRHDPNMLFIFYEDLTKDMASEVRRVAKFLGKAYSDEQIERLCQHLKIDSFRKNKSVNFEDMQNISVAGEQSFIRKGGSGGWREYFDAEMTGEADKWIADNLKNTDIKFPHMDY